MADARTRADDFLTLVQRGERGKLKLYLGFAAGVGKTYRMLEEAHALRDRDVDVVLGFIETHARAETEALVAGIELVPRKTIAYRGVAITELDLDAVLRRRPKIVIIDELAHTNVPGSRNRKRYEDVLELLDAGINVIAAFNVQHLESLNELVARVAGTAVRETVPNYVLKQAGQVVNIDLAVEDLLERLRAGKIYPAAKVAAALENFFQPENLSTLRELSLRQVAESLEVSAAQRAAVKATKDIARATAGGRVMVCLASNGERGTELLHRGSMMAGRLSADWFAVYVQLPSEAPDRIDAETQRRLHGNFARARELGAEVVTLQGVDPVEAILDFARSHAVAHIVIGRSRQAWWKQLLGMSVPLRLVRAAEGFDVHIVAVAA